MLLVSTPLPNCGYGRTKGGWDLERVLDHHVLVIALPGVVGVAACIRYLQDHVVTEILLQTHVPLLGQGTAVIRTDGERRRNLRIGGRVREQPVGEDVCERLLEVQRRSITRELQLVGVEVVEVNPEARADYCARTRFMARPTRGMKPSFFGLDDPGRCD